MLSTDQEILAGIRRDDDEAAERIAAWVELAAAPYRAVPVSDFDPLLTEIKSELTRNLRSDTIQFQGGLRAHVWRHVNRRCLEQLSDSPALDPPPGAELGVDPEESSGIAGYTQTDTALLTSLGTTDPACRDLWHMVRSGMSVREMSEFLGIPEAAVRERTLHCRKQVLTSLPKALGSEPETPAAAEGEPSSG